MQKLNDDVITRIAYACTLRDKYGLTWGDTASIINELLQLSYDESFYRKRFRDVKATNLPADDVAQIIECRMRQCSKDRVKVQTQSAPCRRDVRAEGRRELLYESIREAITTLPVPEFYAPSLNLTPKQQEYVLCLADIQGGARFAVDGNVYSLAEVQRRFEMLQSVVAEYVLRNSVTTLKVVELGDSLQGILRSSDLQLNETSVVEALVTISRLIAMFLTNMSMYCHVEYYHVPTSNHTQTRPLGTKASELSAEDLEYVIGHYIADMVSDNERIDVQLNDNADYIEIPVFDFNVIAMHGHTIKNPETALLHLSNKHHKILDYVFMGHYHTDTQMSGNAHDQHDTEVLICPSFQGTDPYAYHKLGYSAKAACKLYIFHPVYGLTGTEKFILN